jgi:hypothetical protein
MSQRNIYEPWADLGVPGQGRIHRLLYNRPSDTLTVVVQKQLKGGLPVKRLYFRAVTEASYHPIAVQDRLESQEDAACCEAAPFLIYNVIQFRPPERGSSAFAADYAGVRRFNLATSLSEMVLDNQSLRPSPPYVSGWVSSIIALWPDGGGAVCTVDLQRPEGNDRLVTDTFVYEVSFKDGLRRQVAALPRIFL